MPLSEEEQRILRQIEEQLQSDQRFANAVSSSGLYRHSARTLRWAFDGSPNRRIHPAGEDMRG